MWQKRPNAASGQDRHGQGYVFRLSLRETERRLTQRKNKTTTTNTTQQ